MKIGNRLFPYPVLSENSSDYNHNILFDIELNKKGHSLTNIELVAVFKCNCKKINELINEGQAVFVLHGECSTTSFRQQWNSSAPIINIEIPMEKVKNDIEFTGFVISIKNIKELFCNDWDSDFEDTKFDVKIGSILAYKNIGVINVTKNFEEFLDAKSIFTICKNASNVDEPMSVDLSEAKIKLMLDKTSYEIYSSLAQHPAIQTMFNTAIILPALVFVIEELKQAGAEEEYGSKMWYRALSKNYERYGQNIQDVLYSDSSLSIAQDLMEMPITKAFKNISVLV